MKRALKVSNSLLALTCLFLANSIFHSQTSLADQKVTNEIDVQSQLTLPTSKYQRGETTFELTISDAHFERAQGSCAGLRWGGATAFKVVGANEEWEQSLISRNFQDSPYGTILMQTSGGSYSSVFVNPNGSLIKIGAISTGVYANGYAKKSALRFKTNGWKGGDYTLIGFLSDGCRDFTMVTKKFSLPEIPRPELKCTAPSDVYMEDQFEIKCSSNIDLSASGVVAEIKSKQGWVELGEAVAVGTSFSIKGLIVESPGVQELSVYLKGVKDELQDSRSPSFFIQSNPPKLSLKPILVITKKSKNEAASIKMDSGNNSLNATLQSSNTPNGPWQSAAQITNNSPVSSGLSFGTWVRVQYEGNSAINAGVSDPFQILITPTLKCVFPAKVNSGKKFNVTCSSSESLQPTPISLQYLDSSNNWVAISKGTATGMRQTFSYTLNGEGKQRLRIRSEGLRDHYTGFSSNASQVSFVSSPETSKKNGNLGNNSAPKGKVDKGSNAYRLMLNFGRNLAANSLAGDSAQSQCLSAKNSGLVRVRGVPQYLGSQASQIQSYLHTASGFQGCLDGFGK